MSRAEINQAIMGLETETGIPVEQGMYSGTETTYIVFSWVTQAPDYYGDDTPLDDKSKLNVVLYTPMGVNNTSIIDSIREYLEDQEFHVEVWGPNPAPLGDSKKSEFNMQTVFELEKSETH